MGGLSHPSAQAFIGQVVLLLCQDEDGVEPEKVVSSINYGGCELDTNN